MVEKTVLAISTVTVTCPSFDRGNSVPCDYTTATHHCDQCCAPCNSSHGHCVTATRNGQCNCNDHFACHLHATTTTMTGDDVVWTRSKTLPNVYVGRPLQLIEAGTAAVSSKCARRRVTTEPTIDPSSGLRATSAAGHQHTSCDRTSSTSTPGLCNIAHTTSRCDGRCNVSLLNCRPLGKSANDVTLARCRTILGMTTSSTATGLTVGRPLCDVTKYLRTATTQQQQQRESGNSNKESTSSRVVADRRCAPVQTRVVSGSGGATTSVSDSRELGQTHVHVCAPLQQQQQQAGGKRWSADGRDDDGLCQYCTAVPPSRLHHITPPTSNGLPHFADKLPSKPLSVCSKPSNNPVQCSNGSATPSRRRLKRCLDLLFCCFTGNQHPVNDGKS